MHWKRVYYRKTLEKGLQQECIGKGFSIRMHWKRVYYRNKLEKGLLFNENCFIRLH